MKKRYLLLFALFMFSTSQAGICRLIHKIKHSGLRYKVTDYFKQAPELIKAIKCNNMTAFNQLLNKKNIKITDKDKDTPLHWAAYLGRTKMVEKLLENGAEINALDFNGMNALGAAVQNKQFHLVKTLLNAKSKVQIHDKYFGWTCLHYATEHDHVQTIKLLLNAGIDINSEDFIKNTPLKIASLCKNVKALRCLLQNNAKVNAANERGETPLFDAAIQEWKIGSVLLLSYGASRNLVERHFAKTCVDDEGSLRKLKHIHRYLFKLDCRFVPA